MRTVIVCVSVSHGNTRRVADTMAPVLGAKVVAPAEVDLGELAGADLVGFGSGVGGINRQRPDTGDLAAARAFAERLRDGSGPVS